MKKLLLISFLMVGSIVLKANPSFFYSGVNFDYFYSSLEPYGEWIEFDHDVIVWRPLYVRNHWSPYSEGRWVYTNTGWYWDSYEPFGWATYHYGRWFYDDYYGWVWFPDYEWGPSWVEWRYNDNYIGWSPLPPYASFRADFGIHFSIGWHSRHNHWNFVSYPHFHHRDINIYIVDRSTNINIYNKTKYRTNYNYRDGRIINGGVDRNFVERRSGYRIVERNITNTDDYTNYKSRNIDDSRDVVVFRPNDKEVEKSRTIEKSKIIRGESKSSVDFEKVVTRRRDSDEPIGRTSEINRTSTRNDNMKEVERGKANDSAGRSSEIRKSESGRNNSEEINRRGSINTDSNSERTQVRKETRIPDEDKPVKKPVDRKTIKKPEIKDAGRSSNDRKSDSKPAPKIFESKKKDIQKVTKSTKEEKKSEVIKKTERKPVKSSSETKKTPSKTSRKGNSNSN